jgi:hypothetical protein
MRHCRERIHPGESSSRGIKFDVRLYHPVLVHSDSSKEIQSISEHAEGLMARLTIQERIGQLQGLHGATDSFDMRFATKYSGSMCGSLGAINTIFLNLSLDLDQLKIPWFLAKDVINDHGD